MSRTANPVELRSVAEALQIPSVDHLEATFRIGHLAGDRFRLHGRLMARVTQTCVVTLEPVAGEVTEEFDVEFWPEEHIPAAPREADCDPFGEDAPEPLSGRSVEAGRVVYEHLAQGLDPYPRRPGAQFAEPEEEPEATAAQKENPFAVLARLKDAKGRK